MAGEASNPELAHLGDVIDWRAIVNELVEARDEMMVTHDALWGTGRGEGDVAQKLAAAKASDERVSDAWEAARAALGAS